MYNPPEVYRDGLYYGKEDVWALGVAIYQLSSFVLPFDDKISSARIIDKIRDPNIRHSKIDNRSKELNGLIDVLLEKDHTKRPTIKDLFLYFPLVQRAVCDLLQKFIPIKNFIFEELILRLESDKELKKVYAKMIAPMI